MRGIKGGDQPLLNGRAIHLKKIEAIVPNRLDAGQVQTTEVSSSLLALLLSALFLFPCGLDSSGNIMPYSPLYSNTEYLAWYQAPSKRSVNAELN